MAVSANFLELLLDQLSGLGPVRMRRMFGGVGVYCEGVMFALVSDDTLYLKTDETTRADFEAELLSPFSYASKSGRTTIMSYWRAPERLLDDPDDLIAWARTALAAAHRAQKTTPAKRKPARR